MPVTPRPDPGLGLFETMLVVGGRPVELDAHLERLAAGLRRVYEAELPASARALAERRARGLDLGRLRVTVAPAPTGLSTDAVAAPVEEADVFPARERGASLRGLALPGGLGRHKWADRRLLDRAGGGERDLPLLLDGDGTVLEASRASVFAVIEGVPVTPPADGRILPGVTRARVLALAARLGLAPAERELRIADLLAAEEVFLVGSVRGVEPARSLDGVELGDAGEVSRALAAELQRRWIGRALDLA